MISEYKMFRGHFIGRIVNLSSILEIYNITYDISSKRQSFSGKICNVLRTLKRVKLSFKPVTLPSHIHR